MLRIRYRSIRLAIAVAGALLFASCTQPADESKSQSASSKNKNSGESATPKSATRELPRKPTDLAGPPTVPEADKALTAREMATEADVAIETERPRPMPPPKLPPPEGATRLDPDADAWIDAKKGVVIVDGNISLREGMLEMFACLRNTKEHESIVSANTRAYLVHAALVGLGVDPGKPVEFMPAYKPPTGPEIEILVQWRDEDGNEKTVRAQELVKDLRTGQAMAHPFIFAGSLFWKSPDDGRMYYMAEQGDFICVSNFGTAMIDIPVESSQANEERAFVAFTERIPALGTPVRMILKAKPKSDEMKAGDEKKTSDEKGNDTEVGR